MSIAKHLMWLTSLTTGRNTKGKVSNHSIKEMNGHRSDLTKRTLLLLACKTVVLVIEGWQTTSGLTIPSLYVLCSVFVKREMLLTVHVQVELAKRRRERQRPFSTAGALRGNLACGDHINTRTVIKRPHHQGM